MRTTTQRVRWRLVALILLGLVAPASAQQLRILSPSVQPGTEEPEFFTRARQLEEQQRWGEALAVYEEALRDHPKDGALGERHDLAKIHYDLGRRYSDSSF